MLTKPAIVTRIRYTGVEMFTSVSIVAPCTQATEAGAKGGDTCAMVHAWRSSTGVSAVA